jgi:hypothetical protein
MRIFLIFYLTATSLVHAQAQDEHSAAFDAINPNKNDLDQIPPEAHHCSISDRTLTVVSPELDALVEDLGSAKYAERESSHKKLLHALFHDNENGEARHALESALKHEDAEVRHRARSILSDCQEIVYANILECESKEIKLSVSQKFPRPAEGMIVVDSRNKSSQVVKGEFCSDINGELLTMAMTHLDEIQKAIPSEPPYTIFGGRDAGTIFEPFKSLVKRHCCKVSETGPVELGPVTLQHSYHDRSTAFETHFAKLCELSGYQKNVQFPAETKEGESLDKSGVYPHLIGLTATADYYCMEKK